MNLSDLTDLFICCTNDARIIHWNAKGERFDRIHDIFNDLYNDFIKDTDMISESAIENGEQINNPSGAESRISWPPFDIDKIDYETAMRVGFILTKSIVESIDDIFGTYNESVDNMLGDLRQKYSHLCDYKFKRRLNDK